MAAILWKFKLFDVSLIWLQIRNLRPRISGIGLFWTPFIHFSPLFITCQNFWQVCSSDGLFVCLSVCLFVCLFVCNVNDTGRTVQAINTKLGTCMYLGSGYGCIVFGVHDVIDDVIRSKNRSKIIQHPMPTCQEELLSQTGLLKKIERDGAPSHE